MKAKLKKEKSEIGEIFGKNIKYYRKKQKKTQTEVAVAAEISLTYLSELENNKKNLTLDIAVKIARSLRVDIGDMIKKLD